MQTNTLYENLSRELGCYRLRVEPTAATEAAEKARQEGKEPRERPTSFRPGEKNEWPPRYTESLPLVEDPYFLHYTKTSELHQSWAINSGKVEEAMEYAEHMYPISETKQRVQ